MITIRKGLHSEMLASAEQTLIEKCIKANDFLKSGGDIQSVHVALCSANSNLVAIENYMTGEFEPAEYFNISSPYNVSGYFSNTNTVNTGIKNR